MSDTTTGNGLSNRVLTLREVDHNFDYHIRGLRRKKTKMENAGHETYGLSQWQFNKALWELDVQIAESEWWRQKFRDTYGEGA